MNNQELPADKLKHDALILLYCHGWNIYSHGGNIHSHGWNIPFVEVLINVT